jgi:hypothetical protein
MMRLQNVPIALALPTLGIVTAIAGFAGALPWAVMVWAISLVATLVMKLRVMKRLGHFDNAWPLFIVITHFVKRANAITSILIIFGWGALLASVYLFLRLWIWYPGELPFLQSVPFLGAFVTVSLLWLADLVIALLIQLLLFGRTGRRD